MFTFDHSSISVCFLSQLEPGEFFISSTRSDVFVGARIESVEGNPAWLNLTGKHAFELDMDRSGRKKILKISIPGSAVRLRIDHTSMAFNDDHCIGQLVVDETEKASIAVVWPNLAEANYYNTICLDTWRQSSWQGRPLLFNSWALSYIDETGQWADIVRR